MDVLFLAGVRANYLGNDEINDSFYDAKISQIFVRVVRPSGEKTSIWHAFHNYLEGGVEDFFSLAVLFLTTMGRRGVVTRVVAIAGGYGFDSSSCHWVKYKSKDPVWRIRSFPVHI